MKPELLSPVQDFVSLQAAIDAGCDSVYFGILELNMRMGSKNFNLSEVKKIVKLCHANNVKAYLTLNTIVYDNETEKIKKILKAAKKFYIDAVICWDFSVISFADKLNIPIHISTQSSISNFESIKSIKKQFKNIRRIILARELSLIQIKNIIRKLKREKINIEIESFVHGAMCVSVSGRCFLSHDLFGKSANRGECLQPCRRKYKITDIEENHEFLLGKEYILSPKDLCALPVMDKLIASGIKCFKIEGRNRSPEYVKTVTEVYRTVIDNKKANIKILLRKLKTVYNRGFSTGFFLGAPINEWSRSYGSQASKKKIYIGIIKNFYKKINVAEIKVESYGLKINDAIMIQGNKTGVKEDKVLSMQINHKNMNKIKKGLVGVKLKNRFRVNDKVFVIK